jgi:endonuclease I
MSTSRLFVAFAVVGLSALFAACTPQPVESTDDDVQRDVGTEPDVSDDPSDTGSGEEAGMDSSPRADVSSEDSGTSPDTGGNGGTIPARITTDGGAEFRADIAGGQSETIELVANEGDFVVIRMRAADGTNWSPALYLYEPGQSTSEEALVYSEPGEGEEAHIPYQDESLGEGWEFFGAGTYPLVVENRADSGGKLVFELECLDGPCTDGSNGGGSGDDIPAAEDNCPETDNPSQDNRDHDIWGDACDPKPAEFECPQDLSGSELEQRLRAAYGNFDVMSYDQARQRMFGSIDNDSGEVTSVYTGQTIQTNTIPDPEEYNTEHTWPRSKMEESEGATFSDLNHLFPADATANKERSNLPFDEVTGYVEWSSGGSRRGENDRGWKVFEPRDAHKGEVARALFYYSVLYDRDIDIDAEPDGWGIGTGDEETLRQWHNNVDPVGQKDRARNEAIQEVQGNRNPFIDCPGLVGDISDF